MSDSDKVHQVKSNSNQKIKKYHMAIREFLQILKEKTLIIKNIRLENPTTLIKHSSK